MGLFDTVAAIVGPVIGLKTASKQPLLPPVSEHHEARKAFFASCHTHGEIMWVGDSITEAWSAPENQIHMPWPSVNRGIAGDTTVGVIDVLPCLVAERPRAVFLKIGTNNLGWGTPQAVNRIIPDVANIVGVFTAAGARVFLQSILPVNPAILNAALPGVIGRRTLKNINVVNQGLAMVASTRRLVSFVDLFPHFSDAAGNMRPELTTDGLHLSPEGYRVWAEVVRPLAP